MSEKKSLLENIGVYKAVDNIGLGTTVGIGWEIGRRIVDSTFDAVHEVISEYQKNKEERERYKNEQLKNEIRGIVENTMDKYFKEWEREIDSR